MFPNPADWRQVPAHLEVYNKNAPYVSRQQYLQTLKALFREDSVRGLREGIAQLQRGVQTPLNVGLFRDVRIGRTVINGHFGDVVTELSFDFGPHKEVDWEASKWLTYGSLLCLSSDGFATEILFATGQSREPDLRQGQIKVVFPDEIHSVMRANRTYVMMEGTYYLPYANVLAALQSLGSRLPFENELVRCQLSNQRPAYLGNAELQVTDQDRLGGTQKDALWNALSHRLAVIQGPPGTGKTFIGLQIVSTLLKNSPLWRHQGPILIVCTTNHALDQLLEDIVNKNDSQPGDVVRFGGQSKSELLERFNATKLTVKNAALDRDLQPSGRDLYHLKQRLKELLRSGSSPTSPLVLGVAGGIRRKHAERLRLINAAKLRAARVVGMTTSVAAMKHGILQDVSPPIVIVEEAAEVLEAHQLAALSAKTQHLILIGDHQKLRPKTGSDDLAGAPYHLDLSLFERLVCNGFPKTQLDTQRRMRPEISTLMRLPPFYPRLKDDGSVYGRPSILGMAQPVFFWFHKLLEAKQTEEETSRNNPGEADMVANLAKHLRLQEYGYDKITVITFYAKQVEVIKSKLRVQSETEDVEVRTVDGYQGEENDIIILSTVRSRNEGSIDFLSNLNRATVAFSRARNGLYVLGNLPYMARVGTLDESQTHDTWNVIHNLRCQTHGKEFTVSKSSDFERLSPYGGCNQHCNVEQSCGHTCDHNCHTNAFEHESESEPCTKSCLLRCQRDLHTCPKSCQEQCPPCTEQVTYEFDCGHDNNGYCDNNLAEGAGTFVCIERCIRKLPCGHTCVANCATQPCPPCQVKLVKILACGHNTRQEVVCSSKPPPCEQPCERLCKYGHRCKAQCSETCPPCRELREIRLLCGHIFADKCYKTGTCDTELAKRVRTVICPNRCSGKLPCGHVCAANCATQPCPPCQVKLVKTLSCGHSTPQAVVCSSKPPPCEQPCERLCKYGHRCKAQCSETCPPCRELREIRLFCGHIFADKCYKTGTCDTELAKRVRTVICPNRCSRKLPCGHVCAANCATQPCPPCQVKLVKTLSCGHSTPQAVVCSSKPPPCEQPCLLGCQRDFHECPKSCQEQCPPCTEQVIYKLGCGSHKKSGYCDKNLAEGAGTFICTERCIRKLPCGHTCAANCATQPCPPCQVKLVKTLSCGHSTPQAVVCSSKPPPCEQPCLLRCQRDFHECPKSCQEQCPPCTEQVIYKLGCGSHKKSGYCDKNLAEGAGTFICTEQCIRKLPCGHTCAANCATQPCPPCQVKSVKTLSCGHLTRQPVACSSPPPPCAEPCQRLCQFGHRCKALCSQLCPPCRELRGNRLKECSYNVPCPKRLRCGHACSGICGQECPPCPVKETFELPCGHHTEVAIPCFAREAYRCPKPCERLCPALVHGCRRACGEPCRPCWRHDFRRWANSAFARCQD